MVDTITEDEIREKLATHYGGDNSTREFVRNERKDNHGTLGSVVYSLSGSPPKGYAIYTPEIRRISFYDIQGKRFRILDEVTVAEVDD